MFALILLAAAGTVITIGAPWLVLLAGTIIPALVAVVTKDTSGPLQVVVLAVLSAVAGVIAQSTTGTFPLVQTLMTVGLTAVIAIAAHYGLAVSGVAGAIHRKTSGFGLGKPPA